MTSSFLAMRRSTKGTGAAVDRQAHLGRTGAPRRADEPNFAALGAVFGLADLAGVAGLEPATYGFGDGRHSASGAVSRGVSASPSASRAPADRYGHLMPGTHEQAAARLVAYLEKWRRAACGNRERLGGVLADMRRIGILLALALGVFSTAIYLGTRGSTPTGFGLTLTAQRSPAAQGAKRHWTPTRRISLTCGARPAVTGSHTSGRALCDAVAYYSRHFPPPPHVPPCAPVIMNYRRVVISGSLDGRPVRLALGLVCNPPLALSRAVQTIYLAAFR